VAFLFLHAAALWRVALGGEIAAAALCIVGGGGRRGNKAREVWRPLEIYEASAATHNCSVK
jgi:hypothetical protein